MAMRVFPIGYQNDGDLAEQLMRHYVYALCYPDGRVFYIGKGSHPKRIHAHEYEARTGKTRNPHKVNVIRKIWEEGGQVKKKILAYFATDKEAGMYEIALIFFMDGLTNIAPGGEGLSGLVKTEEHIRKVADAITGRIIRAETRLKWSQQRKGKKPSPDAIRKISATARGRKHSDATKRRMSQAAKNKKHTAEHHYKVVKTKKEKQAAFLSINPSLCSIEDAMRILGISERTVFRRIDAGVLHPIQRTPYILLERIELDLLSSQLQGRLF